MGTTVSWLMELALIHAPPPSLLALMSVGKTSGAIVSTSESEHGIPWVMSHGCRRALPVVGTHQVAPRTNLASIGGRTRIAAARQAVGADVRCYFSIWSTASSQFTSISSSCHSPANPRAAAPICVPHGGGIARSSRAAPPSTSTPSAQSAHCVAPSGG